MKAQRELVASVTISNQRLDSIFVFRHLFLSTGIKYILRGEISFLAGSWGLVGRPETVLFEWDSMEPMAQYPEQTPILLKTIDFITMMLSL